MGEAVNLQGNGTEVCGRFAGCHFDHADMSGRRPWAATVMQASDQLHSYPADPPRIYASCGTEVGFADYVAVRPIPNT